MKPEVCLRMVKVSDKTHLQNPKWLPFSLKLVIAAVTTFLMSTSIRLKLNIITDAHIVIYSLYLEMYCYSAQMNKMHGIT